MKKKLLIVEDEFVVANDLRLILQKVGYQVCGMADSFQSALDMIEEHQPTLVLLDIYLKGPKTGIDLARILHEKDIAFVYLSANNNQKVLEEAKATQPYGFLVKPFREKDVLVALEIAYYRHAHSLEAKLRKEQSLQVELARIMAAKLHWEERLLQMAIHLQQAVPFDYIVLGLKKAEEDLPRAVSFFRTGFNEYQSIMLPDLKNMVGVSAEQFAELCHHIFKQGPTLHNGSDFEEECNRMPVKKLLSKKLGLNSNLYVPLTMANGEIFFFSFLNRREDAYTSEHLDLVERLQATLTLSIGRLLAFEEIERLTEQLKREKSYLQEEVKTSSNFEEIIGSSYKMLRVFDLVTQVAPVDTSVLLLGESGTGKELVARAIHNLSSRKDKLLVKMNCAALPANLIESELFGHEKGAFTGAMEKRIGKFELAQGGTIFLDEIGEIPVDLQSKLLRVLQEKEIERIGGSTTIKVDVRIIAATNRNLEEEVAAGKFRLDLYYRLNVFPVTLPPLRERKDDIPLLANFFGHKFSRKTGKPFHGIKAEAMDEMLRYHWPGNIREMENLVEQAFVLNDGRSPLQWGRPLNNDRVVPESLVVEMVPKTLNDVKEGQLAAEREYILSILKQTNGRIRGAGGAAELLNLKPTTLESRMEKLGIKKMHILKDKETGS
ncbi:sigma 54-interacting transcriptional regulator [Pseudobacter ginsenosidimutans]|uniref:Transcriptional regulator with GAF, ATPase, and Fis domain n=1 Tax=Pseudobacter ginsenosidimutans TaxID=661488 RepID=A0A4Q7MM68_9BACT|nr:sigma 54-interacting transcriptional regulator [Pseudobacter ginsenosidimutans]QEC40280.1 response regulator [Pseudobacter ginsenosidimutans]RZS69117.1 transcriptional regulator with GAF, ATPase, and Fis domain [Pseudobacter ginsenosidimutans]